ncbi:phosphate/phosphite/phosphonate ABC transporter substrate-binding protein [Marinobacterium rhizophilum]|uniref:Phosphate/phosphite/phosphonate ABC transporter substrate-binding protein n=1 Tax=Marinobacterium rhizophilum TaxID=420402 RepID=A0ABY5HJC8_9GAMM|nr:phosphate/phosphite/phosphonate ABC transporter substrate-binding protein [Marinobacterium rhizophilum]UTW11360.1 phosphate/phosphite/phosphonate ABC transporter substrate-binding protein [Marinobacterium rhizophilum]
MLHRYGHAPVYPGAINPPAEPRSRSPVTRPGPVLRGVAVVLLVLTILLADALTLAPRAATQEPLLLGILPRRNPTLTTELFSPLVNYLSTSLGREIQLVTSRDFKSFLQDVKDGRFDIVHYNQFHYVRSSAQYRVIAHNEEFDRSTVAGALYVKHDSGISRVEQLRGKRIIFGGGEDAMMSYILPRYLLLQAGLQPGDYQEVFAKSPPNSLIALYYDEAQASGAGDILIDLTVVKDSVDTSQLTHLAVTEQLLHLPWAVRRTMEDEDAARIQSLLVGLEASQEGLAILEKAQMSGMGIANDDSYAPHRRIIDQVMPSQDRH